MLLCHKRLARGQIKFCVCIAIVLIKKIGRPDRPAHGISDPKGKLAVCAIRLRDCRYGLSALECALARRKKVSGQQSSAGRATGIFPAAKTY